MNTAIVILNYNGKQLLEQFLPSVLKYSTAAKVYVADNDSQDQSLDFLKEHYPEVNTIINTKNYGYAGGYNRVLEQIPEEFICLLNNDVQVTENWLLPILNEFKKSPNTAVIQPKILDYRNKDYFEYAGASGGFLDKFGFPYCRGRIFDTVEQDQGQYNSEISTLWASGACFFIRKSSFREIGGFDDKFFAHMEEIDLCWRLFNRGYDIKTIPQSEVYHLGGGTLNYDNPRKTYLNFRNNLFMLVKNIPENLFIILFIRLFFDGLAALFFILKFRFNNFLAVMKAHVSFYYHLPLYLNKRTKVHPTRKYYHKKSIVWSYFIKGCKTYRCL